MPTFTPLKQFSSSADPETAADLESASGLLGSPHDPTVRAKLLVAYRGRRADE